eukprot:scaffold2428_cov412-Prasinococcus_capsulatus_cf.AAC.4
MGELEVSHCRRAPDSERGRVVNATRRQGAAVGAACRQVLVRAGHPPSWHVYDIYERKPEPAFSHARCA